MFKFENYYKLYEIRHSRKNFYVSLSSSEEPPYYIVLKASHSLKYYKKHLKSHHY